MLWHFHVWPSSMALRPLFGPLLPWSLLQPCMTYTIISVKWRINRRGFTTLNRLSVLKTARYSEPINFLVAPVNNNPLPRSQYNLGQYRVAPVISAGRVQILTDIMSMTRCVHFLLLYFHSKPMRKYVRYRCVCLLWVLHKGSLIWAHSRPWSV